jgi:hypothetical protein
MAEGLVKVRIIQQASGPGSVPLGTILEVTPEEARGLCSAGASQSTPFAVMVTEDRTETADAPEKRNVETRGTSTATAAPKVQEPAKAEEPKAEEEPAKRGPGRPPGSTNRPKPQ